MTCRGFPSSQRGSQGRGDGLGTAALQGNQDHLGHDQDEKGDDASRDEHGTHEGRHAAESSGSTSSQNRRSGVVWGLPN